MVNELFKKLVNDKDGHVVVWQWPNAPLSVWICLTAFNFFVHGRLNLLLGYIASIALLTWAIGEIGWGESLFRRLFGGIVLIAMVAGLIMRIHL